MERAIMATIRIPYVKEYRDKTGVVRRYFRKRGCKSVVLPGAPGCSEFMAAYQAAMGTATERRSAHGAGTVGALIIESLGDPPSPTSDHHPSGLTEPCLINSGRSTGIDQ